MKTFNQHNQYNILLEDITSKVRKLRKLSPADKKKVIDFFKKNNQLEKEIDWDNKNLTITDFQAVFHTPTKSKTNKSVKKKGISGLREGVDYIDVTYMFENHNAYIPLHYEASKHIASRYIGNCTGKWCTAYQKTANYWNDYAINNKILFVYLVSPDKEEKYAWAISLKNNKWEIYDKKDEIVYSIPGENVHRIYKRYKRDLKKYNEMVDRDYDNHWIKNVYKGMNANYEIKNDIMIKWISGTWYDGVWEHGEWVNGSWQNGTWNGGTWRNGTWWNGTWRTGTWLNGTWKNGTWENGDWEGGIWHKGTWKGGRWYNGTWKTGTWYDGVWENGTWELGTWYEGAWKKGEWKGGIWKDGGWKSGTWENGQWEDGVWRSGSWNKGLWFRGLWETGTWKTGTWYNGTWKTGTWYDGTWVNGIWEYGEWHNGIWRYGVWYNGEWYDGVWENGDWEGGIWHKGTWKSGEWLGGFDSNRNYHEAGDSPDKW